MTPMRPEENEIAFQGQSEGREIRTYTSGGQVLDCGAPETACTYYDNGGCLQF